MEKLQPMTDLLFGEGSEQRPTVIAIGDLQRWFAQKQKHRAYKAARSSAAVQHLCVLDERHRLV